MDARLEKELNRLIDQNEWEEIVKMIEEIPEAERDWETIGQYIRALNNSGLADLAVTVSLKYREQGASDPLWHYRLGYAYWALERYEESTEMLDRGKELALGDAQATQLIDELIEWLDEDKNRLAKAETEARRRAAYISRNLIFH